jgi:hypothetical protein
MGGRLLAAGAAERPTTFRVAVTGLALAAARARAGLVAFTAARARAGFVAFTAGRLRAVVRLATRARAAGFRVFLEVFAALPLDAVRFRLAVFLAAARLRPAAFRPPLVFLPACPERRRGARAAFRLAMDRPFVGDYATLTVSDK